MVGRGLQHNHSCSRQCALLPCRLTDSKWRFYFCASLAGRASLCGKERSQQHVPGCIQGDIPAEQTQLSWESLDSGQSLDLLAWSMCSQAVNKHAWVGMRVRARERAHARAHTHTHTHTHTLRILICSHFLLHTHTPASPNYLSSWNAQCVFYTMIIIYPNYGSMASRMQLTHIHFLLPLHFA